MRAWASASFTEFTGGSCWGGGGDGSPAEGGDALAAALPSSTCGIKWAADICPEPRARRFSSVRDKSGETPPNNRDAGGLVTDARGNANVFDC